MPGKIKHVRQKLHQQAVKMSRPSSVDTPTSPNIQHARIVSPPENRQLVKQPLTASTFPTGIFAGTKITPQHLVQTLKIKETPIKHTPGKKGPDRVPPKRQLTKREKYEEKLKNWWIKRHHFKKAQQELKAKAHRQATPVVGDLRPLTDALTELSQLSGPATTAPARRKGRKDRTPRPSKRPAPTDFSQMKQSQKRKVLESESSSFSEAVKTLCGTKNPLADIGEQLRKRMRQEEELSPSG